LPVLLYWASFVAWSYTALLSFWQKGNTALMYAAAVGRRTTAIMLLEHGANPRIVNEVHRSASQCFYHALKNIVQLLSLLYVQKGQTAMSMALEGKHTLTAPVLNPNRVILKVAFQFT
jgi:hypothetical protein